MRPLSPSKHTVVAEVKKGAPEPKPTPPADLKPVVEAISDVADELSRIADRKPEPASWVDKVIAEFKRLTNSVQSIADRKSDSTDAAKIVAKAIESRETPTAPRKWTFTVSRDTSGRITSVEARASD
jgi:hypothetical protein